MSTFATCPQGHRWEVGLDTRAGPLPTCPVCGAGAVAPPPEASAATNPAEPLTGEGEATSIVDEGAPPRTAVGSHSAGRRGSPSSSQIILPVVSGYEVLGLLGRGGMGVVYKARQLGLNRLIALKMLPAEMPADAPGLVRFRREAEAVARLQHPNIVQVYEVGDWDGRPFFSMEYVEGGNLVLLLQRGLPVPRQAAQTVEALARAVHYAHQRGILHRDLKPGNVMLTREGVPKVTDFGLAKILQDSGGGPASFASHTRTGEILGTPSYMAPEQAAGHTRDAGPGADVYSLGAILYEMLTGRPPFEGPLVKILHRVLNEEPVAPARLQPKVPRDLQTVCLKCLEKDAARRYPTAEGLADDLRAFLAGEAVQARPAGRRERLARWVRRRPTAALLVGVVTVALAGGLVGALWYGTLAVGAVAVLGLLAGGGWYSARLRAALRDLELAQVRAERNVERLHLLLEATRRLMGVTRPDELLRLLGETTTLMANAERATIYLVDRERGELWSKVTTDTEVGEIRVPLGRGIAGTVAQSGEIINLSDPYVDPRFNPEIDRRTGYRTRNMLTLPMTGRDGDIVGVFQVLNKRTGPFEAEDLEMLQSLAASAALAVERAR